MVSTPASTKIGSESRLSEVRGARLDRADLWQADLVGANLRSVTWTDVTCPDGAASSTGCSGNSITSADEWYPVQPAAGFDKWKYGWYEYRPTLRATPGAPLVGGDAYGRDGVQGMIKNSSGQRVMVMLYRGNGDKGYEQTVLEDGAEVPYQLPISSIPLEFYPAVTGQVQSLQLNSRGQYYDVLNPPTVVFEGGGGQGATARVVLYDNDAENEQGHVIGGQIVGLEITNPGSGYTSAPTVVFDTGGSDGEGATAQAFLGGQASSTITLPAKLSLTDPLIGRPSSAFTPVGSTDPVSERTGWKEGESHHEISGGTTLWLKRENDGWKVPASDAYKALYGDPNTRGSSDWAIFTIVIEKLG